MWRGLLFPSGLVLRLRGVAFLFRLLFLVFEGEAVLLFAFCFQSLILVANGVYFGGGRSRCQSEKLASHQAPWRPLILIKAMETTLTKKEEKRKSKKGGKE